MVLQTTLSQFPRITTKTISSGSRFPFQESLNKAGTAFLSGAKSFFGSKTGQVATKTAVGGGLVGTGGFLASLGLSSLTEPFKQVDTFTGIEGSGFIVIVAIIILLLVVVVK